MTTPQPQGPFCQSCAMPMEKPEDFGTSADGNRNEEYCRYCYQSGKFTDPDITREQMIESRRHYETDANARFTNRAC